MELECRADRAITRIQPLDGEVILLCAVTSIYIIGNAVVASAACSGSLNRLQSGFAAGAVGNGLIILYLGDVLAFRCSYSNTDPIAQCTIAIGVHLQVLGSEGYIVNALGLTVSHYIVLCQAFIRQSIILVIQRRLYKFLIILFGQYSNASILSCCRSALVREGDHSCGNAHQGCQHQGKQFLLVHFVSLL